MFRKTRTESQLDAFSSIPNLLTGKSYEQFNDPDYWNNVFRTQVLGRINEDIFMVLFEEKKGAPNSSVSTLLGMMILKEAFGLSESQLFERCRFDMLMRSALGLFNMSDPLPVESTYYLFRSRINEYTKKSGIDLIEKAFNEITKGQVIDFCVSGNTVRMDSKLISSNIAFYKRYEIVHQTLALFCKNIDNETKANLNTEESELMKEILKEEGGKVVYRSNKEEVTHRMHYLGELAYKLIMMTKHLSNPYFQTLQRVFNEHFQVKEEEKIEIRPREEIKAESVQSPHDPECGYRNKDDKPVKGYSYNFTETCDKDELSLITSIQVETATIPDNDFLIPATEQTKEVLGHPLENLHTDGAYNSQTNQIYIQEEKINLYLSALQGQKGRFDLNLTEKGLEVTDMKTNEKQLAIQTKTGKWRIKVDNKIRYFTQKQIDSCRLRKEIEQYPPEIRKIRNNVEATIFQVCFYTRNNKSKYRGKIKQKMWATFRCIWINLVRIINYLRKQSPESVFNVRIGLKNSFFSLFHSIKKAIIADYPGFLLKYSVFLYLLPEIKIKPSL